MKEALCRAFCDDLLVRKVPAGLAVSTGFLGGDGDKIGFYVVDSDHGSLKRIEESGTTYALLEASGVDFRSETRRQALNCLLEEHSVTFDEQDRSFYIDRLREQDIPGAALRFVAFSLRIRDFLLMTEYRVASTFREDAARELRKVIGEKAKIFEGEAIAPPLADSPADFVLRTQGRPPVGIFLGTSDNRVYEAILVNMRALHEVNIICSVTVLVERLSAISSRVRQQALNRLAAFAEFRGDEEAAIQRVARDAIGPSSTENFSNSR
jgi:hypothetical protein